MSQYDGTLKFDTKIDKSGFESGLGKLGGAAGRGLAILTKAYAVAAGAVAGFGASAYKAGSEFEDGMSAVEAIAGGRLLSDLGSLESAASQYGIEFEKGSATAADAMSILEEHALNVASTSIFTAGQAAEAYRYMGMAGWDAGQMLGGLQGVMDLAAASGGDLGRASDIVTDAMTAFGMRAGDTVSVMRRLEDGAAPVAVELEQTARFVDVLAAAASSSNTNVDMMGETFKFVAPVAGAMGYSIEDMAHAIGLMANSGIKASQAGTSLRNILTNMANPTEKMEIAMDTLGISLDDGRGNMLSFEEVMLQLRDGFSELKKAPAEFGEGLAELSTAFENGELSEEQYEKAVERLSDRCFDAEGALKAQYAAMLAGKYGMSGLLAIVNASDEEFNELALAIANSEGRAREMADMMNKNVPGALRMVGSALDILGVKMYRSIQEPAFDNLIAIRDMVNGMMAAFEDAGFDGFARALGDSLAKVFVMLTDSVVTIFDMGAKMMQGFAEGLLSNEGELQNNAGKLITGLIKSFLSFSDNFLKVGVSIVAGIIDGIGKNANQLALSAFTVIENLLSGIDSNMPMIVTGAGRIISALVNGFVTHGPRMLESAGSIIGQLVQGLIQGLPQLIPAVASIIQNLTGYLFEHRNEIIQGAGDLIMALVDGIIAALPTIAMAAVDIIGALVGGLIENWDVIVDIGLKIIEGIIFGLGAVWDLITGALDAIFRAIWEGLKTLFQISSPSKVMEDLGKDILQGLINGVLSLLGEITEAMGQIFDAIWDKISTTWDNVTTKTNEIWNNLKTWLGTTWNNLKRDANEKFNTIKSHLSDTWNNVKQKATDTWNSIKTTLSSTWENLKTSAQTKFNALKNDLSAKWDSIKQKATETWNNIKTSLSSTWDNIKSAAQTKFNALKEDLSSKWDNVKQKASETWSNIKGDLSTTWDNIKQSADEKFNEVKTNLSSTWDDIKADAESAWGEVKGKAEEGMSGVVSAISGAAGDALAAAAEVGGNIVSGVWNGIEGARSWFSSSVSGFFSGIVNSAKSSLGIKSPSTVFRDEIGKWMIPGAVEGMKRSLPVATREARGLMDDLVSQMRSTAAVQMEMTTGAQYGYAPVGNTYVTYDNRVSQNNEYHVPVASPAEVSEKQREAARKLLGGY